MAAPVTVDVGDVATWVGSGVALLAGVSGLIFGVLANKRAERANEIAERANRIAAEAVGKAAEANEIAEDANQLGSEANAIARRALAQQTDYSVVDWTVKWEPKSGALRVVNDGDDPACEVVVLIRGDEVRETRHYDRIEADDTILIDLPQVREQINQATANSLSRFERMRDSGGPVAFPSKGKAVLKVTVAWKSELGVPQTREFDITAK
jgi:hypothetical protein